MPDSIAEAVRIAELGEDVPESLMEEAVTCLMQGGAEEELIARLLVALAEKGEAVCEIVGAARALRRMMRPIRSSHQVVLDIVGTGGDRSGTFNISTAAALVAAAAGVPVAKHGNRSVTSPCGSADVLHEVGMNIEAPPFVVEACLEKFGFCFCFAPLAHPAMKVVAPVRKKLGRPTIFNILGPLANPASATHQLLGVGRAELRLKLAEALRWLGTERAWVVFGADGLDEISLSSFTHVTEATRWGIRHFELEPGDFGLRSLPRYELLVDSPAQSANMLRRILRGDPGPARDVVLANAAAALVVASKASNLTEGVEQAAEAIDSGSAMRLLEEVICFTRELT